MRCVVASADDFVGSHLCESLLSQGDEVVGIDSFTDYYDPSCKERNLEVAQGNESFTLWREDLVHDVVQAMRAAALSGVTGVANIGGGSRAFEGFGYVPQVQPRRGSALMVEAERPAISV